MTWYGVASLKDKITKKKDILYRVSSNCLVAAAQKNESNQVTTSLRQLLLS